MMKTLYCEDCGVELTIPQGVKRIRRHYCDKCRSIRIHNRKQNPDRKMPVLHKDALCWTCANCNGLKCGWVRSNGTELPDGARLDVVKLSRHVVRVMAECPNYRRVDNG